MTNLPSLSQTYNYLKYKLSKPSEILKYGPLMLSVNVTSRCNIKCDFCHVHSDNIGDFEYKHRVTPDLSYDLFEEFVDKFSDAVSISLIGSGEPLLNKDFFRMVEYSKKNKMLVSTSTNGINSSQHIKEILTSGIDVFEVSINGFDEESFYLNTRQPKEFFGRIVDFVKELVKQKKIYRSKTQIVLTSVIDRNNYIQTEATVFLAESLGVDKIAFQQFLPTPTRGYTPNERCMFTSDTEIVDYFKNLDLDKYAVGISLPQLLSANYRVCNSHFELMRIDGNGRVGGCSVMLLNNDDNGYFSENDVWNSDYFVEMRKGFLSGNPDNYLFPCKYCASSCGESIQD
ncbi:MAG: radical SAM protein [Nitrospirae bacterium]|nr:MAG: radical SAM protein [Nitrospirota bacterium]